MGLKELKLVLNHSDSTYKSGDILAAKIKISSTTPLKVNEITYTIKGRAKTKWKEDFGSTVYHYEGEENYFHETYTVIKKSRLEPLELSAGENVFEFNYQIPPGIPPSFEGQKGNIRYVIKVLMDRPRKFDDNIIVPFYIVSGLDLNLFAIFDSTILEPVTLLMEREFCCCFNYGSIGGIVKIPCSGYVCGQNIPVTIEIENQSNVHVEHIEVLFKKYVQFYTSGRKYCIQKEEVLKSGYFGNRVKAKKSNSFTFNIKIPRTDIINLFNCNVIDIIHLLKFNLILSGCNSDIPGKIPIILGTVPLSDNLIQTEALRNSN